MMTLEMVNRDSPIHRLSPITKLYLLFALLFVILASFNLLVLLGASAFCFVFWAIGRISVNEFKKFFAMVGAVCLVFIIANGFFYYEGTTTMFTLRILRRHAEFTAEGFVFGSAVACKIVASFSVFPILTLTTPISRLLAALAFLRLPYKIIFAFGAAVRFVPLMQQTWHDIIDAQRLRGHDLKRIKLPARLWRGYIPIAIPLLLSILHKSQSLDIAIESRAFGAPGRRTFIDEIRPGAVDWLVMVITTLFCGGLFVASIVNGWGAGLVGIINPGTVING